MASEAQIQAVCDAVISAFAGDAALWAAFLVRSKLVTELEALESELRNMQTEEDAQNAAYLAEVVAQNEAIAAKQAEMDAL